MQVSPLRFVIIQCRSSIRDVSLFFKYKWCLLCNQMKKRLVGAVQRLALLWVHHLRPRVRYKTNNTMSHSNCSTIVTELGRFKWTGRLMGNIFISTDVQLHVWLFVVVISIFVALALLFKVLYSHLKWVLL